MNKPGIKKLYYSIGEVSEITELKPYVLRYWETEFKTLNPPKNRAGNRTYRQKDIDMILEIKDLLYNRKFTIEGARTQLSGAAREVPGPAGDGEPAITDERKAEILRRIREELADIVNILKN